MKVRTPLQGDSPDESFRTDRATTHGRTIPVRATSVPFLPGIALALLLLSSNAFAQEPAATGAGRDVAEPVDVVFVLDNSGSMRQNDPLFLTREAVANFASALARDESIDGRIAIVLFDGQARLIRGLTGLEPDRADDLLDPALVELDYSGQRTNSPAGIERALYELSQNGRDDARRAIILLSDGQIDTGSAEENLEASRWLREDLANESEASGIRIFGVAFTEAADFQLMQALASRTHARYYRAFEASQLTEVVADVLARVTEEDFYRLSLSNAVTLDQTGSNPPATPPPVSAAPSAEPDGPSRIGLLALLPLALFLAGGALLWRQRSGQSSVAAPPAQLLDIAGHLGTSGAAIELSETITRIGRDPHNDIVLDEDTISSEHAIIEISDGRYWLEDQRSTNGTHLGDERLEPGQRIQLKGGDHVRLSDIDLMFVMTGYVPGGATVFLSSPTSSPPAWNEPESVEAPASHPTVAQPVVLESQAAEMASPEHATGLDHEQDLDSADPGNAVRVEDPDQEPPHDDDQAERSMRRGQLSLLRTPAESDRERKRETAEPPSEQPLSIEFTAFRQSLDYHLRMVSEISPAFASFIERVFDEELRGALVVAMHELTAKANEAGQIQQKQYTFDRIRFAICGIPGEIANARDRFAESFGGFTRLLTEHLQSESFRKDRCETLAVLSAGCGESPWVSLSIVPDDGQDPRIDLLSYEFLTPSERQDIESNEHVEVSHSGFA